MSDYERVAKVIRYLNSHYQEQPNLSRLAKVAQLSDFHFHRLFSRWAGVTPKSFLKFLTLKHAKETLRETRSVLDTSLDCGLSGPSRLHDLFVSVEAVTPGEFKTRGDGVEIRYGFHDTSFGLCLIGITSRGVCHLTFLDPTDKQTALKELCGSWPRATFHEHQESTAHGLSNIFEGGRKRRSTVTVFLSGTPFQLKVWEALLRIPLGRTLSYKDVAQSIGQPGAARAVGSAIARNPIAYLVPCHRVIRDSGVVAGYRWGSVRKQALLAWESSVSQSSSANNQDGKSS